MTIREYIISIDKILDNTLDKAIPSMQNEKRKVKSYVGLLFTLIYIITIFLSLVWYGTTEYNMFHKPIEKSVYSIIFVVLSCTALSYMIYTDIRYYTKKLLYSI